MSTGDIVSFLNSGDYYLPHTIDVVNKTFTQHPEIICIYGNIIVNNKEYGPRKGLASCGGARLYHPATFMKREVFDAIDGFSLDYPICADLDLFIRAKKIFQFYYTNTPLAIFTLGGISTKSPIRTAIETDLVLRNNNFPFIQRKLLLSYEILKHIVRKIVK